MLSITKLGEFFKEICMNFFELNFSCLETVNEKKFNLKKAKLILFQLYFS